MKQHSLQKGLWKCNYNSKNFVNSFDDFIDWEKRREGENGFLVNTLMRYHAKSVLDAGMGTACDAIYLAKEGFKVTGNEVDNAFYKKALQNAKREKASFEVVQYDWRVLSEKLGENRFDAVLLLGNSLAYIYEREEQVRAVNNFLKILKPSGILLIDERNYPYIMSHKEEILNKKSVASDRYVYCGTKTEVHPTSIEENKIVFEYIHNNKQYSLLALYPFKKGEMLEIIKAAGFLSVQQYSDYKPGYNENADFFQYVAVK